ncbi:hypothetical protein Taro_017380 [Colocasia esculenta]|uniref:Uncharacterized protein n=1 Tax=Colocasia esculenta TaxID=4460 RepID=A0A843UMZ1_COLES|nr:hypothetical protein [Colocasia esculenta]
MFQPQTASQPYGGSGGSMKTMVEAGAKQKTRRFTKLKKIWVPKKETQKFEDQANTSKMVWRKKNVKNNHLQDAGFEHSRGRKRKDMYRKSNYISQDSENTRVDKQTSTQQSKGRISVFDRISRIPVFDKLRATPSANIRPSKRRRVTWAAQEKPRLIIFSCYAIGMESSEVAEQIAEATPNISTGATGPDINDPSNIMSPQMDAFQNIAIQRHEIKKMVEDMFA